VKQERTPISWTAVHERLQASELALQTALHPDEKANRAALERCAARLALPPVDESDRTDASTLLVFRLGADRFAVDLKEVAEVGELRQCTPVPGGPVELRGVICHRGEVRSVIDLAGLLGRASGDKAAGGGCFIHLRAGGKERRMCVDGLDQILTIRKSEAAAATGSEMGLPDRYVKSIHHDGTVVLRGDALCAGEAPVSGTGVEA